MQKKRKRERQRDKGVGGIWNKNHEHNSVLADAWKCVISQGFFSIAKYLWHYQNMGKPFDETWNSLIYGICIIKHR